MDEVLVLDLGVRGGDGVGVVMGSGAKGWGSDQALSRLVVGFEDGIEVLAFVSDRAVS